MYLHRNVALHIPRASAHCGGIKAILNSIMNPYFKEIQETLVLTLVLLLNEEDTRKYIRTALDIGVINDRSQ